MANLNAIYSRRFLEEVERDSRPMAAVLAPWLAAQGITTAVDYGCGTGVWVQMMVDAGIDAMGVEGVDAAWDQPACSSARLIHHDLRFPFPAQWLTERVPLDWTRLDLALSIEVAEHLRPRYARAYLKNLTCGHPAHLVMTAAPPGQGGRWHVNEQSQTYWIDLLATMDYVLDVPWGDAVADELTRARAEGVWIPAWMPGNLMVFQPRLHG